MVKQIQIIFELACCLFVRKSQPTAADGFSGYYGAGQQPKKVTQPLHVTLLQIATKCITRSVFKPCKRQIKPITTISTLSP